MSRRSLARAPVLCTFTLVAAAAVVMREADRSTRCPLPNTPVGEQLTVQTAATSGDSCKTSGTPGRTRHRRARRANDAHAGAFSVDRPYGLRFLPIGVDHVKRPS